MENKQDIADNQDAYHNLIKSQIFRNLHAVLLESIGTHLRSVDGHKVHAILGPSGSVSPYLSNPKLFREQFKDQSHVMLVDYNPAILYSAYKALSRSGMTEILEPRLYHSADAAEQICRDEKGLEGRVSIIPDSQNSNFRLTRKEAEESNAITLIEHNLKSGVPLPDESADCIDATLSLHHIAPYTWQLVGFLKDAYRSLKKGGMLFWGEGFVDMRYSEEKIKRIAKDMAALTGKDVIIEDRRDEVYPVNLRYSSLKGISFVPETTQTDREQSAIVTIDSKGYIHFPHLSALNDYFSHGKGNYEAPLIDSMDPVDYERHVKPIEAFYKAHIPLIKSISDQGADEPVISSILEAQQREMRNAAAGIVEFYSSEQTMLECLKAAGFEKVEVLKPNKEILPDYAQIGAIVAYK